MNKAYGFNRRLGTNLKDLDKMRKARYTMKCPVCGSQKFFLKDPADEYETYEFELKDGQAKFAAEPQADAAGN